MRLKAVASYFFAATLAVTSCLPAQGRPPTYAETRKLLLTVDRSPANDALKKLFKEGDARRADLVHALYDPDERVSLNSQTILKYLADREALAAVEEWYASRRKLGERYWISPVTLAPEVRYLGSASKDLERLVLKKMFSSYEDTPMSVTVVAYNKRLETALVEIIIGDVFTSGDHVVVRKEGGKWRLVSRSHVWDS